MLRKNTGFVKNIDALTDRKIIVIRSVTTKLAQFSTFCDMYERTEKVLKERQMKAGTKKRINNVKLTI